MSTFSAEPATLEQGLRTCEMPSTSLPLIDRVPIPAGQDRLSVFCLSIRVSLKFNNKRLCFCSSQWSTAHMFLKIRVLSPNIFMRRNLFIIVLIHRLHKELHRTASWWCFFWISENIFFLYIDFVQWCAKYGTCFCFLLILILLPCLQLFKHYLSYELYSCFQVILCV